MQSVRRIASKIKKIWLLIYLIYKSNRVHRVQKKAPESDNILLVSGGGIGDAVMDASAWEALIEHYTKQGKAMFLLTSKANWNYFKMVLDTSRIVCIETASGKDMTKKSAAKQFGDIDGMTFDTIILRSERNYWLDLMTRSIRCRKIYTVFWPEISKGNALKAIGYALIPSQTEITETIVEDIGMNETWGNEELLHTIGLPDYRMHIVPISKQDVNVSFEGNYITVTVDSQNPNRRWGSKKTIELIDWLLERFDSDIVITGNNLPDDEIQLYCETYENEERVKNTIGRYSFVEWVELLRGARFHIGVDSGSIHIAASVGTVAFCLAGVWDGYRIFPYGMTEYMLGTVAPICIYRKDVDVNSLPCFCCASKTGVYGGGNRECKNSCRAGKPCICLEKITVRDVIEVIEKAICDGVFD